MSIHDFRSVLSEKRNSVSLWTAVFFSVGIVLFYILKLRLPEGYELACRLGSEYIGLLFALLIFLFICAAFSVIGFVTLPVCLPAMAFFLCTTAQVTVPTLTLTAGNVLLLIALSFLCTFSTLVFSTCAVSFSRDSFSFLLSEPSKRKQAAVLLYLFVFLVFAILSVLFLLKPI